MLKNSKIYLAGHNGMVGSAILRVLFKNKYLNIITRKKEELNLRDANQVNEFFFNVKPDIVVFCAAKVGGIAANLEKPSEFLIENIEMQNNCMMSSLAYGVKNFIFLGSSCIYPKNSPQPIREDYLLNGKLEPSNEGYALAKIVGLKLLEFLKKQYGFKSISIMPCNLYGPNDSFDLNNSHVLSAMVRKFMDAKIENKLKVTNWGTGKAKREFLHVDDLAQGVLMLMERAEHIDLINIGSGEDVSIKELSEMIATKVGFMGEVMWDSNKPDGMLAKCLDTNMIEKMGFKQKISLSDGIEEMIKNYKEYST